MTPPRLSLSRCLRCVVIAVRRCAVIAPRRCVVFARPLLPPLSSEHTSRPRPPLIRPAAAAALRGSGAAIAPHRLVAPTVSLTRGRPGRLIAPRRGRRVAAKGAAALLRCAAATVLRGPVAYCSRAAARDVRSSTLAAAPRRSGALIAHHRLIAFQGSAIRRLAIGRLDTAGLDGPLLVALLRRRVALLRRRVDYCAESPFCA